MTILPTILKENKCCNWTTKILKIVKAWRICVILTMTLIFDRSFHSHPCLCFKTSSPAKPPYEPAGGKQIHILKWFCTKTHFDTEAKTNSKMACSKTNSSSFNNEPRKLNASKASNSSHFHIPAISQPCSIRYLFLFFDTFSHLKNLKPCVHRGVTTPQGQQHVCYAQQS